MSILCFGLPLFHLATQRVHQRLPPIFRRSGAVGMVLVDGMEDNVLVGRLSTQAPEIDGVVYLSETEAQPGEFVDVAITDAMEYDLVGKGVKTD